MANRVAQEAFNHLIGDLKATHGDNLASVVLYGSAAAGDFVREESDYNLLIALHRIAPEDLRLAQPPMREWQRLGHPLPVYFTSRELRDAADVFPIEFYQMERARVVLYRRDPCDSLSSFATLFAPVLMLYGEEPPVLKREVARATVRLLGLDGAAFERVFEL